MSTSSPKKTVAIVLKKEIRLGIKNLCREYARDKNVFVPLIDYLNLTRNRNYLHFKLLISFLSREPWQKCLAKMPEQKRMQPIQRNSLSWELSEM
jgi:hypothetical protein